MNRGLTLWLLLIFCNKLKQDEQLSICCSSQAQVRSLPGNNTASCGFIQRSFSKQGSVLLGFGIKHKTPGVVTAAVLDFPVTVWQHCSTHRLSAAFSSQTGAAIKALLSLDLYPLLFICCFSLILPTLVIHPSLSSPQRHLSDSYFPGFSIKFFLRAFQL